MSIADFPVHTFANADEFEAWLADNHTSDGILIKMAKKASGIPSIDWDGALEVALCYGWIDGQRNTFDDTYFLQKFTPRRAKSTWSQRNVEKIAQLIAAERMKPSGHAQVELAKKDGRWQAAYASPKNMVIPADFLVALEKNKKALAFFETLNRSNLYAIYFRLETAKKPETRERRFNAIMSSLENEQKLV